MTWSPSTAVSVLIGFPLGGGSDIVGRPVLAEMERGWGVPLVVRNMPGANGVKAAVRVAGAAPDGCTLLLGHISSNAIAPAVLGDRHEADLVRSLVPISRIASQPHVLVVRSSSKVSSLRVFVELGRNSDSPLKYGSTGYGSLQHYAAEKFAQAAKFSVQHVPYAGSTPAMRALIDGEIDFIFEGVVPAAPLIQDGALNALGLSTRQRIPALDVEPVSAQGFADFHLRGWWGLFAPAGTPFSIVEGIYAALLGGLREPNFLELARSLGLIVNGESPRTFAKFVQSEIDAYEASTAALMMIRPENEFVPA